MPPPRQLDRVPWVRVAVAGVFLLAGLGWSGARGVNPFRPPPGKHYDFVQEWLSARNFAAGLPVYEYQFTSARRHIPPDQFHEQAFTLPYNAHPPGSVLLALPVAGLSYPDAHLAWNLCTLPLFLLAVGLAVREVADPFRWWHLVPVAALLVWADPVYCTVLYGQLNFVLALLLTLGWVFDRRGRQIPAGVCVGLAAGLKLFPAFVFLYFLASGRWKGLLAGVAAAVAVNAAAVGVFSVGAFQDYVRDVLPSLKVWEGTWPNESLNGLWTRAVDPPPEQAGPEAFRSPLLAKAGYGVSALLVTAGVGWAAWRSRKALDPDLGWAAAVAALPLVSPLAWQHYYTVLIPTLAVLVARLGGWKRWVGWAAVGGLALHDGVYLLLFVAKSHYTARTREPPFFTPLDPVENLLGTGMITLFGLVLFVLTLLLPRRES